MLKGDTLIEFGEWGEEPIHPKQLRIYGYENVGNIHKEWKTGLSLSILETILQDMNVDRKIYSYIPFGCPFVQCHSCYSINQAKDAIDRIIKSSYKISNVFYRSDLLGSKFKIDDVTDD